eukprot:1710565-Amphidinium_carterae.2
MMSSHAVLVLLSLWRHSRLVGHGKIMDSSTGVYLAQNTQRSGTSLAISYAFSKVPFVPGSPLCHRLAKSFVSSSAVCSSRFDPCDDCP